MAVWELAILILALTYGFVNVFSMIYMVKLMNKYDGIITRGLKLAEKGLDQLEKQMSEDDELI